MAALQAGFTIFTIVAASLIVASACLLLLIRFGHPDDRVGAWFPKVVTVLGLYLSAGTILAMPLDVANTQMRIGLPMDQVWAGIFITIVTAITVVVPYAFFFYESDSDPNGAGGAVAACGKQTWTALLYTLATVVVFGLILGVAYYYLHVAEVPLQQQRRSAMSLSPAYPPSGADMVFQCDSATGCDTVPVQWNQPVSFAIFSGAVASFLGWFFFTLFGGIGLVALPVDLINEFRTRPARMTVAEYAKQRVALGRRATALLLLAAALDRSTRLMTRRSKRRDRTTLNRLEVEVHALKRDKRLLEESYYLKGGNPVFYFAKLVAGVFALNLTLTWTVHIAVFVLAGQQTPFLNQLFLDLTTGIAGFGLFGVLSFAAYALYLLACCVKGVFRLGLRIPCLIRIYPMELGNTMMNAFLFNTWIVLICTIPVAHFCTIAFGPYVSGTSVRAIFGVQVFYLKVFRLLWANNAFIWAMLAVMALTCVGMVAFPKDKALEIDRRLQQQVDDLESGGIDALE